MTEQDKPGKQPELTQNLNNPRLDSGGNFMPEDGKEGNGPDTKPAPIAKKAAKRQPNPNQEPVTPYQESIELHKKKLAQQWRDKVPLTDKSHFSVRAVIDAMIDSGMGPDRVSEEELDYYRELAEGGPNVDYVEPPLPPMGDRKSEEEELRPPPVDMLSKLKEAAGLSKANLTPEQAEEARKILEILDDPEIKDSVDALSKALDAKSAEDAKQIIINDGEELLNFYSKGLDEETAEIYRNTFKELEDMDPKTARLYFQGILEDIRIAREANGLDDPLENAGEAVLQRWLPDEVKKAFDEIEKMGDDLHQKEIEQEDWMGPTKTHRSKADAEEVAKRLRRLAGLPDEGPIKPMNPSKTHEKIKDENPSHPIKDQSLRGIYDYIDQLIQSQSEIDESSLEAIMVNKDFSAILGHFPNGRQVLDEFIHSLKNKDFLGANQILKNIDGAFSKMQEGGRRGDIRSIEDIVDKIASEQDKEIWGIDGVLPLIDKITGEVKIENFLLWVREQSLDQHIKNSSREMSPLGEVGLLNEYGSLISIFMMTRFKEKFLAGEDGRVFARLADQLLNEAFMFGEFRNKDLIYTQIMGDDTELPNKESGLHISNSLVIGRNLIEMYNMPAVFKEEGGSDTRVGDAFRFANDIYYNLSDPEELIKILGPNNLFTQEDFIQAIKILHEKRDWDPDIGDFDGFYKNGRFAWIDSDGNSVDLFDSNGKIIMKSFSNALNIYNDATPKGSKVNLLRELIRIKAAKRYGLDTGIANSPEEEYEVRTQWEKNKEAAGGGIKGEAEADRKLIVKRKAQRINIMFAETNSFVFQRPYGIAAKHDIGRKGYDARTKTEAIEDYLYRQSGERTAGPIGVPDRVGVFRSLTTDMISGLITESNESPLQILTDIREIENDQRLSDVQKQALRNRLIEKMTFKERAESEFTNNQVKRAFQIYHGLTGAEMLDLNKIITFSFLEGLKINAAEFEKQIKDGYIKPMRYAFSSNSGLKYSQEVRRYNPRIGEKDQKGRPKGEWETVLLAEKIFGPEVLADLLNGKDLRDSSGKLNQDVVKFLDTPEGRIRLVKNAARADIAAQMRYHRRFESTGEKWDAARTEMFYKALSTIRALEPDPEHPGRPRFTNDRFFSKEDMNWIRKNSGTGTKRMFTEEFGLELATGSLEGFFKMIKVAVTQ